MAVINLFEVSEQGVETDDCFWDINKCCYPNYKCSQKHCLYKYTKQVLRNKRMCLTQTWQWKNLNMACTILYVCITGSSSNSVDAQNRFRTRQVRIYVDEKRAVFKYFGRPCTLFQLNLTKLHGLLVLLKILQLLYR